MAHSDVLPLETSGGNKGNQSKDQNRDVKLKWSEKEPGQQSILNSVEGKHQVAC